MMIEAIKASIINKQQVDIVVSKQSVFYMNMLLSRLCEEVPIKPNVRLLTSTKCDLNNIVYYDHFYLEEMRNAYHGR